MVLGAAGFTKPESYKAMPREAKHKKLERAIEVAQQLDKLYANEKCPLKYWESPFKLTVAVMLSAQTTDTAVNKVTPTLWQHYPTPKNLSNANMPDVQTILRPIGFHKTKAKNCIGIAKMVDGEFGGNIPRSIDALQKLPGVGRKTANVVLNEAFGIVEGIAVDTHVFRIAHKLKLVSKAANTPQKTEDELLKLYPKKYWANINRNWVLFGREVCSAKNPRCNTCPVAGVCPSAD